MRHPHPCEDEGMFPIPMGGLVEVHEVHVDAFIRNLRVVLGQQMKVWLLQ